MRLLGDEHASIRVGIFLLLCSTSRFSKDL